jgi:uncharacterized lipoprotein YmbA
MIRFHLVTAAFLSVLFATLFGCRMASPPVSYYILEPIRQEQTVASAKAEQTVVAVGIRHIELPGYLNRLAIVRRSGERQVEIESLHRWADYLDRMVQQTIRANLQVLMPHASVIITPWPVGLKPDVILDYQFLELIGGPDQTMRMKVEWTVYDQSRPAPPKTHRLNLTESMKGTRFDALAAAHSAVLESLCRKTIESLSALSKDAQSTEIRN